MQPPVPSPARKARALRRGTAAEVLAARHLRRHGLAVLARNVRCRAGEIDLVCRDGEMLVIVEVRYRKSSAYGGALASVTPHKRQKLVRAASYVLTRVPSLRSRAVRFDVVGIDRRRDGGLDLTWVKDAFAAG